MAKKKKETERELVKEVELSNGIIIKVYDTDGTASGEMITPLDEEDLEKLFQSEEDGEGEDTEEEETDGDETEDGDGDDEELTPEALMEMDFEELEELCEDNELETDPDEFDEDEPKDVEKLRKEIAKELGIKLPKAEAKGKKKKK